MKLRRLLFFSLLVALACAACSAPAPIYASGAEKDQVVAAVTPFAQHILDGLQQKDYALFSRDFNDNMVKNFPEESFTKMVDYFTTYGAFKSSQLTNVQIVDAYYQANYQITFANKTLSMGILLPKTDLTHVSGLWFE
jgi:hypothetical protein